MSVKVISFFGTSPPAISVTFSPAGNVAAANVHVGSGVATKSAGTAANMTAAIGTSGKQYLTIADITRDAGTVGAYPGSGTTVFGTTAATTLSATYAMVASGSGMGFRGDASFAGTIDNASVREIL
jgi:hypothetical protein